MGLRKPATTTAITTEDSENDLLNTIDHRKALPKPAATARKTTAAAATRRQANEMAGDSETMVMEGFLLVAAQAEWHPGH